MFKQSRTNENLLSKNSQILKSERAENESQFTILVFEAKHLFAVAHTVGNPVTQRTYYFAHKLSSRAVRSLVT